MDGSATIGLGEPLHILHVPFDATDGLSVSLSFNNRSAVRIDAEAARLTLMGEAEFVEQLRRA